MDTGIASVNSKGVVTGVAKGQTQVEVAAIQGEVRKVGYCTVKVNESQTFTKVTSTLSNWAGKYLIVCEGSDKAFNSSASDIDSTSNATSVTITNDSIASTTALQQAMVVVEQVGSQYVMKTSTGQVLSNSDKSFKIDTTGEAKVNIAIKSGQLELKFNGGSKLLMFNKSWGGFRFYSSGQTPVQLYRLG